MYVAQGRFVVNKAPESIELASYATLGFVTKMDPVIKHKALNPADVTPTKDPAAAFARRPDLPWCDAGTTCIESRYDLEGKLPLGVKLANRLEGRFEEDRRVRLVPERVAHPAPGARPPPSAP